MHIFLKYLIKNIMEKKFRTTLVVLSIAVTAGLFFATESISTTAQTNMEERVRKLTGTSDIIIQPIEDSSLAQYIDISKSSKYKERLEYAIGIIEAKVLYTPSDESMTYIDILGIDFEDLDHFNPLSLYKEEELLPFEENKIIISKYMSEQYNLNVGSSMELEILNEKINFTVAAISYQKGLFINETTGLVAVIPKATLGKFYKAQGNINKLYLKLERHTEIQEMLGLLSEEYVEAEVKESVSQAALERSASAAARPFRLVSILIIFMSIFIVYTAFSVIAIERIPIIGAFRSIGATKKQMSQLFILESVFLGVAGGIIGCIIGIIALYLMALIYIPHLTHSNDIKISFTLAQLMVTIIFAMVLAVGSSLIPIIKRTKMPIRAIILNSPMKKIRNRKIMPITAGLLFVASLLVPRLLKPNLIAFIVSNIALSAILVSLLILIPSVTRMLVKALTHVNMLKNETVIGIKNIEGNNSLLNNIKLITISLASLIFIMSISTSISRNIGDLYEEQFSYDIRMTYRYADSEFVNELSNIEGVNGVASVFEVNNIDIVNKSYHINAIYGIDDIEFLNYHNMKVEEGSLKAISELDIGRNILITELLSAKMGAKLGDKLILDVEDIEREYVVTGFVDTSFSKGDIVFVSANHLKEDTGLKYYSKTYIRSKDDVNKVYDKIKRKFLKDILVIRTLKEIEEINKAPLKSTFDIIIAYSLLAVLIGIVGIVNNLIVSFIERKHYFAIYRSIGMSKKSMRKMLFSEAMFIGVFGALFGIIGALSMISIMPYMLRFIYGDVRAVYSISTFVFTILITIGIMSLTAIIPARKSTQMSIIESIKYE